MDYEAENTDSRAIHYEIGAHPGFNYPMEDGKSFDDYVLEFEHEETISSMVYDAKAGQFDASSLTTAVRRRFIIPCSIWMRSFLTI